MDQYETRLRADIASCVEQIVQLRADINAQMVRKTTLEHALAVYEETKPRKAAPGGSTGPNGFLLVSGLGSDSAIGDTGTYHK